jgi:hypothetical protein
MTPYFGQVKVGDEKLFSTFEKYMDPWYVMEFFSKHSEKFKTVFKTYLQMFGYTNIL